MRKPKKEIQLTSYDELLGINEAEQNTLNQIVEVPLNELHPFRNHPFHVNDDEKMAETVESIKMIIPGLSEPPVRTLRATIPENGSHIFR